MHSSLASQFIEHFNFPLQEMDSPHILLQDETTVFSELVAQTGSSTSTFLRRMAAASFYKRFLE